MQLVRFANALAAVLFVNGVLFLCVCQESLASDKAEDARKYAQTLKTGKDAKARTAALLELGKLGQIQKSLAEPAMPDILKALEDKDAGVRAAAAECLGRCDPDPDKAVPALVKMLNEDKDDAAKIGAAKGLAAMGTSAKAAAKDLQKVFKDADKKSQLGKAAKAAFQSVNGKQK
jgi:HEAT repeat protein